MKSDPAFDDWVERARAADIVAAATSRGASLKRVGRELVGPCPNCGGADRFALSPSKQIFNCRGSVGGDVIKLVEHVDGVSFMQACEILTGEPPPNGKSKPLSDAERAKRDQQRERAQAAQRQREAEQEQYEADTTEAALAIWNACKPIKGTLAEAYLASRGLVDLPATLPLGFHPALPYPGKGGMPALVARVSDLNGDLCAVWRIYLAKDGSGKADVPAAKLGLGPAGGGAVRLGGEGDHIGVAEGVETALAVMKLNALGKLNYPVWAALSTSGMVALELPLNVSHVTIFPDGDLPIRKKDGEYVTTAGAPGIKAARTLQQRLVSEGVKASIAALPAPGTDYLDLWASTAREVA